MNQQSDFTAALFDPNTSVSAALKTWNGSDPARRFDVYRNNVLSALIEALADTFPVTQQLVGKRFFRAMARAFAGAHPPRSPVMSDYGDAFPAFIERFSPAGSVPYLADVARLEYFRVRAYHAPDADPLDAKALASHLADSERLPMLRASLHPSATLLQSRFAAISIWAAHQGNGELAHIDIRQPEQALVIRPALAVDVVPLDSGSWHFAAALQRGENLGAALESVTATVARFDPVASLGRLIQAGLITSLQPAPECQR
ncbi:MAG: putative DNA-binding domain-containing protein [Oceanospirillaceae bacterium]|nr:putative DNA-binding domain-containing protein [Oceanospirillaceae bacterium]